MRTIPEAPLPPLSSCAFPPPPPPPPDPEFALASVPRPPELVRKPPSPAPP